MESLKNQELERLQASLREVITDSKRVRAEKESAKRLLSERDREMEKVQKNLQELSQVMSYYGIKAFIDAVSIAEAFRIRVRPRVS